jgi:hypothetical protein
VRAAAFCRCLFLPGNTTDGTEHLRQALAIYERLGVPEAQEVAEILASLPES